MTKRLNLTAAIVAASLVAGGCASGRAPYQPPVDSDYRVQINHAFDAVPNDTRIYFQSGERRSEEEVDRFDTFCALRLRGPGEETDYANPVAPGLFAISSVELGYRSSDYPYYGVQAGDTLIGFGLIGHRAAAEYPWEHGGPPSFVLYRVEMHLRAAAQPQVKTLTCSRQRNLRGSFYPSLDEMREALGDIIEIDAAAP